MTIEKLGYKYYNIYEIIGSGYNSRVFSKIYLYYTKKEALSLFKKELKKN